MPCIQKLCIDFRAYIDIRVLYLWIDKFLILIFVTKKSELIEQFKNYLTLKFERNQMMIFVM